jgi:hypothetical protein
MIPNTEWKKVSASMLAGAIFALVCILSYTIIDGMNGGYALAFISFFLAVSSAAVALLFRYRARMMDRILADPSPLAHWTYPKEMDYASVEREYQDYRERNHVMFILIGGMLVLVALFFLIFVSEGGLETGIFLLAFTAFLFVISRLAPWLERQRAIHTPGEAVITRDGIIYEGSVYPFHSFLVSRDGVSFRKEDKKNDAALVFSFTQLVGRFIIQPFDIVVPVPPGEVEGAGKIVRELGGNGSE